MCKSLEALNACGCDVSGVLNRKFIDEEFYSAQAVRMALAESFMS